jgi:hypothetical protein
MLDSLNTVTATVSAIEAGEAVAGRTIVTSNPTRVTCDLEQRLGRWQVAAT